MLKNYKELMVWQKFYQLCLDIYSVTRKFPKEEIYGLSAQMRRAAVSLPSNIAEGYGRRTTADSVRYPYIAYGSICELETQVLLAKDLDYIHGSELNGLQQALGDVERALKGLIKSLERKRSTTRPLDP